MPPHFASPVPPRAALTYSVDIQTVTALAELKYAAAGVAIKIYVAWFEGRTPRPTSVAIMNGRIYKDSPTFFGTQPASAFTNSSTVLTKKSTGISGNAIRAADFAKRLAFASGRNSETPPSG